MDPLTTLGLDPSGTSLLKNQAYAHASYINAWVRRLWDSSDWPEWTVIDVFNVNQLNHYVTWDQIPVATNAHSLLFVGKILKVYLVDPRTTWAGRRFEP